MKAKIKSTGEIVDVIAYGGDTIRSKYDNVSYIDSEGIEHHAVLGLNYYWDFEELGDIGISPNWEQRRYDMAKDFTATLLGRLNYDPFTANVCCCCSDGEPVNPYSHIASMVVNVADAVIEELKKEVRNDSNRINPPVEENKR